MADSESSTVRGCDVATGGGRAHVGGDKLFAENLFRFGDRRALPCALCCWVFSSCRTLVVHRAGYSNQSIACMQEH